MGLQGGWSLGSGLSFLVISFLTACPVSLLTVRWFPAPLYLLYLLAPLTGYLAAWFVWGITPGLMLLILLGGAVIWSWQAGGLATFKHFGHELTRLVLIGLTLWGLWALLAYGGMTLSSQNPLPLGPGGVLVIAGFLAVPLSFSWRLWQRWQPGPSVRPLAAWGWLLGMLAFAFFPAVRVDCRGLKDDPYLRYIVGVPQRWPKHPEEIPGREELPAGFTFTETTPAVTGCFQRVSGRSRLFSFAASAPQVAVFLTDLNTVDQSNYSYAALFSLPGHQKLTHWTRTAEPFTSLSTHQPYFNPFWTVYPELPALPPELRR